MTQPKIFNVNHCDAFIQIFSRWWKRVPRCLNFMNSTEISALECSLYSSILHLLIRKKNLRRDPVMRPPFYFICVRKCRPLELETNLRAQLQTKADYANNELLSKVPEQSHEFVA